MLTVSNKHVALIGIRSLPPEFSGTSGVEFYSQGLIRELVLQNIITVYTRTWAHGYKGIVDGVRYIPLPSIHTTSLDTVTNSFIATLHASLSTCDIVWYQSSGSTLFSWIPKLFHKRVFVTLHTLEWKREKWSRIGKYVLFLSERIGIKSADRVYVVSPDLQEYVKCRYAKQALLALPTTQRFLRTPPGKLLRRYNLHTKRYILFVGRFVPEKRIEMLIRAFLRANLPDIKLVLSGGGVVKYEHMLRNASKKNSNIIFTGWVFETEKQELMSHCGLFVLPSSIEGNPIVLHELPLQTKVVLFQHIAQQVSFSGVVVQRVSDEKALLEVIQSSFAGN